MIIVFWIMLVFNGWFALCWWSDARNDYAIVKKVIDEAYVQKGLGHRDPQKTLRYSLIGLNIGILGLASIVHMLISVFSGA